MVTLIKQFTKRFKQTKDSIIHPLVSFLHAFHITPNHLTNLRLLSNIPFFYFFPDTRIAVSLFLFMLLLDGLDGALARYTNTSSDRGTFLDLLVDLICYQFFIFTFLSYGYLDVLIAGVHLLVFPITNLLAVIRYNEGEKTDWIIKSAPNLVYLKFPFILTLLLFWMGYDYLNPVVYTLNILYGILAIHFYLTLQKKWFPKT